MRIRQSFVPAGCLGRGGSKIQERKLTVRDTMTIDVLREQRLFEKRSSVFETGSRSKLRAAPHMHAHGNLVDHEYEIEQDGKTIATVSKKWFRLKETESTSNSLQRLHDVISARKLWRIFAPGASCGVLSRSISLATFLWRN